MNNPTLEPENDFEREGSGLIYRWGAFLVVVACLIAGAIAYPHLPDTVPTHWGFDGQPDGWGPKIQAILKRHWKNIQELVGDFRKVESVRAERMWPYYIV